jgi:hypothetical protein
MEIYIVLLITIGLQSLLTCGHASSHLLPDGKLREQVWNSEKINTQHLGLKRSGTQNSVLNKLFSSCFSSFIFTYEVFEGRVLVHLLLSLHLLSLGFG